MYAADLRGSLSAAQDWIARSRSPKTGGSRAYYAPLRGWSGTHPEATGALISTVLDGNNEALARSFGHFLIDVQHADGAWCSGIWPHRNAAFRDVMSTAQISRGLCALHRHTAEAEWLASAQRAADWLVAHADRANASYHTQVAWALLEVWSLTADAAQREAAVEILERVRQRRTLIGTFKGWGFGGSDSAYTHTIGYTLRGFLESARLLDAWPRYGKPVVAALRKLSADAIASDGRLPGAYDISWRSDPRFACLSGSAQIALCLLRAHALTGNFRYSSAARVLITEICRHQSPDHPIRGMRGGVPGSHPFWGRYFRGRYPSWAAKYLCDAINLSSAVGF
jgi:hypothetical protein